MDAMMDSLIHRGPDDWGTLTNVKMNYHPRLNDLFVETKEMAEFSLGHRRLSIIDLTDAGRQPMYFQKEGVAITFNGLIYNYIELKDELTGKYLFKTVTDTEVLLMAYREWGISMLDKLDGMFAFAIIDFKKNICFAARDHFGIKPLYYSYLADKYFLFASEPKSVLRGIETNGSLNWKQASDHLVLGIMDHNEGTFFKEVKQLMPGHYLSLDLKESSISVTRYWNPPVNSSNISYDPPKTYKEIALNAISRQLRADVPIGYSLSGGIDSSTIVTLAGTILEDRSFQHNTLTFSFPGFANDESERARAIARNAGMQWQSVIPSMDTISKDIEEMTINMGEPYSTLSMFAQFKVMQEAKKMGLTVMLDGQGGDEVYLGYSRMLQKVMLHYLYKGNLRKFWTEWKGLERNSSLSLFRSMIGNIYYNFEKVTTTRRKYRFRSLISKDLLTAYDKEVAEDRFAAKTIFEKQNDEITKYCLPRLLRFADRNSMIFGIEQRVPHLSRPLAEFVLGLPLEWRVNNGWSKYIVRESMSGLIPDYILWDNIKRGFDVPQEFWIDKLSGLITEWIESMPSDVPIDLENLKNTIKGPHRGEYFIWSVISLVAFIHYSRINT
jgi:asparagine synthase (glutamine-hydrolysing)